MEEYRLEASPKVLSRIVGLLYLIIIIGGIFGEAFIRNRVIVSGDAAATAANIRSLESLWRFGIASEIFMLTCAVVMAWIFFVLLRPVSKDLAWLATFFHLVSIALEAGNELRLLETLFPLGSAGYLRALEPEQLYAMMSLSLRSYASGFNLSLIFFGWFCIIAGYLIFRSGYFPKVIGILILIAGLSYLLNSFSLILAPNLAGRLGYSLMAPVLIGEASLCLWLLLKGVNVEKWKSHASSRPTRNAAATI
jgi:UPF0716 family protein affecting phage T7 exclusion